MNDTLTAYDVLMALARRHQYPEWSFMTELVVNNRRLDALALSAYNGTCIIYEIKVARADFLRELNQPEKRRLGVTLGHKFYFVAPKDMIDPAELPEGCGLMEVNGDGVARIRKSVRRQAPPNPPWWLVGALARRMQMAHGAGLTMTLSQVDAQLQRARKAHHALRPASLDEKDRESFWEMGRAIQTAADLIRQRQHLAPVDTTDHALHIANAQHQQEVTP